MDCQSHSDSVVQEPCARREADTDAAWKEEGAGQPGRRDSELEQHSGVDGRWAKAQTGTLPHTGNASTARPGRWAQHLSVKCKVPEDEAEPS